MPELNDILIIAGFLAIVIAVLLVLRRLTRSMPKESTRESWLRWRACTRKRSYKTKREAEVIVDRHASQGDVVESYQCRFCGKWHVGHPSPWLRN
ncbi:MAG: hypothetical protein WD533_07725 [Dehalococcoidia bacterium]